MKTPGQIGYEAMLKLIRSRPISATILEWTEDEKMAFEEAIGKWESQPKQLRDDWECVAAAILTEARQ